MILIILNKRIVGLNILFIHDLLYVNKQYAYLWRNNSICSVFLNLFDHRTFPICYILANSAFKKQMFYTCFYMHINQGNFYVDYM